MLGHANTLLKPTKVLYQTLFTNNHIVIDHGFKRKRNIHRYIPTHTTPFHVISIVQIADVHLAGKDQRNARVLIPLFNKAISIVSTVYKPLYSSHTSRPLGGTPICILSTRILSFQVGEKLTFTNLSKMSSNHEDMSVLTLWTFYKEQNGSDRVIVHFFFVTFRQICQLVYCMWLHF